MDGFFSGRAEKFSDAQNIFGRTDVEKKIDEKIRSEKIVFCVFRQDFVDLEAYGPQNQLPRQILL